MRLDTGFGGRSDASGQRCHGWTFSTGTSSRSPYLPNSLRPGFLTLTAGTTGQVCCVPEARVDVTQLQLTAQSIHKTE